MNNCEWTLVASEQKVRARAGDAEHVAHGERERAQAEHVAREWARHFLAARQHHHQRDDHHPRADAVREHRIHNRHCN